LSNEPAFSRFNAIPVNTRLADRLTRELRVFVDAFRSVEADVAVATEAVVTINADLGDRVAVMVAVRALVFPWTSQIVPRRLKKVGSAEIKNLKFRINGINIR
jgi:hypothetical protein